MPRPPGQTATHSLRVLLRAALLGLLLHYGPSAAAQIVVDHSFGPGGALTPTNGNFDINAGYGSTVGTNLFQSFSQFNIQAGQTATFSAPAASNIQNVLARVTGNSISNINGTLSSTIPNADVYLINPSGIVFGPHASLQVKGSFAATTANTVKLKGGGQYNASAPSNSVLSTARPSAFGFLTNAPQPIRIAGTKGTSLQVPVGKAVSLVAGDLEIKGTTIGATAGRINVVSVASPGDVGFDMAQPNSPIDTSSFTRMGNVDIRNYSTLDVSDGGLTNAAGQGAGSVVIRANDFTLANNSVVLSQVRETGMGGFVDVQAANRVSVSNFSLIATDTTTSASAGNICIVAKDLSLSEGFVEANTDGAGNGGMVTVNVSGHLQIADGGYISSATIATAVTNAGDAGDIYISAHNLFIGAPDSAGYASAISAQSLGSGAAGQISINTTGPINLANGGLIDASANVVSGGDITIQTGSNLNLSGGSLISAQAAQSGGNVTLNFDGHPSGLYAFDSMILAFSEAGEGGSVSIAGPDVVVLDRSTITARAGQNLGGQVNVQTQGFFSSDSTVAGTGGVTISSLLVNPAGALLPSTARPARFRVVDQYLASPSQRVAAIETARKFVDQLGGGSGNPTVGTGPNSNRQAAPRSLARLPRQLQRNPVVAVEVPRRQGSLAATAVVLVNAATSQLVSPDVYEIASRPSPGEEVPVGDNNSLFVSADDSNARGTSGP